MINLVVSLAVGIVLAVVVRLAGFPWLAGIIPGTIAFLATFVVMGRRTFQQLQAINTQVQTELQSLPPNPKEQKVRVEKAIKTLESALPLGRWQFLIESEVHGQIGILKYMFKDFEGAQASLVKANPRNYLATAMRAALAFQKKDFAASEKLFEEAVKHGKKEGMIWAAYAWTLLQNKKKDEAIKVLARSVEANPSDEKLKTALVSLQNDKKLKMKAWEPAWWQLGLEAPQAPQPMFSHGGGRRMRFGR